MCINVRLISPYPCQPLLRQTLQHSGRWGKYNFLLDDEAAGYDYLVVIEELLKDKESVLCPSENTIFIAFEPPEIRKYDERFLRQFNYVITCQREMEHPNKTYFCQGHPWHVNKDYDFLAGNNVINKTKKIEIGRIDQTIEGSVFSLPGNKLLNIFKKLNEPYVFFPKI